LASFPAQWHEAVVPGTVAASLHHDLDTPGNYDADDWWYRTSFPAPAGTPGARHRLRFEGLATLASVWLNGTAILSSRNMFVAQSVDVTRLLRDENQLLIAFHSLDAELAKKRARPRWKTALVEHQNLRWVRTTLLGRIPGWTPPVTPVGPWRPIVLECHERLELTELDLQAWAEGTTGRLKIVATASLLKGRAADAARLRLGDDSYPLNLRGAREVSIEGDLAIEEVPLWWPHTHGTPRLLSCGVELRVDGEWIRLDCGPVGFKQIALDQSDGRARFLVNGVPVFCRGACWTTSDLLTLCGEPAALRHALVLARDAGVNMLRIGGTMVYESADFYRLCDELGILVWQDFMFANMDYPVGDEQFRGEVDAEVEHQLKRLQRHVSIAAYCGGSEIAQQAAMLGLPAGEWSNEFFAEALPRRCSQRHAGIPYLPSTPWGGALPFHVGTGISHYYGVGAYRRPLSDAKASNVKFAAECLGFANVPDPETMALVMEGKTPPPHHPRWKARLPRDSGAGWDFEDIRDHYLKLLFNADPIELRSQDLERYYALSRVVSGEVMQRVFSEWRNPSGSCGGALVWFFKDLWPGAGWGIVDSTGRPKAAYWHLKRAWAPQAIRITDEGLDGLQLHLINDRPEPIEVEAELELLQDGRIATGAAKASVQIPARAAISLQGDALLGYFSDSTYAYRFGPPKYDVITARLKRRETGRVLSEDFYFPGGLQLPRQRHAAVTADAQWQDDGRVVVSLRSDVFLQALSISCQDFVADDNYFHLAPNQERRIAFSPLSRELTRFKAEFEALNFAETISLRAQR
jgi:beta-mannosidase